MSRLWIGMYLCVCLLVEIATCKQVDGKSGSGVSNCSCYSFHEELTSRKHLCEDLHGNLVSMETLDEWKFITTNIQNITTNEWWIGLERRDGGAWTWVSNHTLTYDKWLRGIPHNSPEKKFVTIVKEFNGTQGLFNQTKDGDHRGRICEYHTEKNCSNDKLRWCRSSSSTSHPALSSPTPARDGTGAWNDTGIGPRYPAGCAVIKKQYTPVVIPILVALAGLVVIVAINIITIKCRNATQGSSKKRDKSENRSRQVDMDLAERTTIDVGALSGIEDEENAQPTEDCVGNSPRGPDEGTNDIIDIDASCGKTAKPEQPYYVNVQGITRQETLPDADTNGHYTLVGNVSETEGQNDSFVVVRTYSIVCDDDNIHGQSEDMNTANYATVSDTLGTREQVPLVTTESGYASVDVINGDSQQGHLAGTNAQHDGSAQYAVVDSQKKNSKKHKTKQAENQYMTDEGYAPTEVIYDNCQDVNTQHDGRAPDTGTRPEYAVVNKSLKKKNRSVKETPQPSKTEEASYASIDMNAGHNNTQHTLADRAPDTGTRPEYAVVNKSMKKKNRSVKGTPQPSKTEEASYASIDVKAGKNNTQHTLADRAPDTGTRPEYAVVIKSLKKKNRSVKETPQPSKTEEVSYASIDVKAGQNNTQHTLADRAPDTGTRPEYAVVNKSMNKKNRSVRETTTQPCKTEEASYASIDVKAGQNNTQHTLADSAPNVGTKAEYAVVNKSMKKKNRSVKETPQPSKTEEVSYDSVDVKAQQNNTQHTLADSAPDTGARPEYAVVNKSMKKKNRSVKESTTQPCKTEEASYASVDVKCCQEAPQMEEQRGSRRKNNKNESVSTGTAQLEYAAVDKSKKKNRSIKNASNLSEPTEVSYASVECCQDGAPKPRQRGSRRKTEDNKQQTPAENDSNAVVKAEYAVVDQTKNSCAKEIAQPSEAAEASYASVDVIYDNYKISC